MDNQLDSNTEPNSSQTSSNKNHQKDKGISNLPAKLVMVTFAMFGFGFALVPLYEVFCEVTGINGRGFERQENAITVSSSDSVQTESDSLQTEKTLPTRTIKAQFIAMPQTGFSGDFYPQSTELQVGLSSAITTAYIARNASNQKVQLHAVPSISPAEAATYVTKMECFCFQEQFLESNQQREMGLTFSVSADLPEHINKITFSYSLYPAVVDTPETTAKTESKSIKQNETSDEITGGISYEPNT